MQHQLCQFLFSRFRSASLLSDLCCLRPTTHWLLAMKNVTSFSSADDCRVKSPGLATIMLTCAWKMLQFQFEIETSIQHAELVKSRNAAQSSFVRKAFLTTGTSFFVVPGYEASIEIWTKMKNNGKAGGTGWSTEPLSAPIPQRIQYD